MVQFDVRAADRLWEGIPPAHGAPGWYDDVSGLIETATGPAEPQELVDEPVVVEDMHQTTLGRHRGRCHRGRIVGRVIAMKAAAATTASVLGVAAAAAATTGIVATVASVVVPVIEEHVLPADDDEHESATPTTPPAGAPGGSSDTRLDDQPVDLAAVPPAAPAPTPGPQAADPEPAVASVPPAPIAPAVEPVAGLAPPPPPAPLPSVAARPAAPPRAARGHSRAASRNRSDATTPSGRGRPTTRGSAAGQSPAELSAGRVGANRVGVNRIRSPGTGAGRRAAAGRGQAFSHLRVGRRPARQAPTSAGHVGRRSRL